MRTLGVGIGVGWFLGHSPRMGGSHESSKFAMVSSDVCRMTWWNSPPFWGRYWLNVMMMFFTYESLRCVCFAISLYGCASMYGYIPKHRVIMSAGVGAMLSCVKTFW